MTHTSTEQPEALPCPFCGARAKFDEHDADCYFTKLQALKQSKDTADMGPAIELIAAWNRRTPASQARVPLSADEIKEPKNGEAWRVEWWNESLRMMLPSDKALHRFNAYRNGTIQFTLKARAHGVTQEKQG